MSALPPHTGILREENLALRYIFGYGHETSAFTPFGTKLPHTSITDILFVSVDVDTFGSYDSIEEDQQFHIGISTFDTRHLPELLVSLDDPSATLDRHQYAINSHQFVIGNKLYSKRARRRFLFGTSESISLSDVKSKFESLTQNRDFALVFHGGNEDMKILRQLDVGSQAMYTLDTVKIAQFPLQLYYRHSLEKLLDLLHIPHTNLHAAGNDAHFALRALLMLVVEDAKLQPENIDTSLLNVFKAIAQAPLPVLRKEVSITEQTKESSPPKLGVMAKRRARAERKRFCCLTCGADGAFVGHLCAV
ncbi:hypothetical protein BGZ63DRAFT_433799 [Mariannaea sp. PMI_226]|nr:hypothetical protein BGZ63DRAFT_433799 [Mariannaea sp. PMI_226]